MTYKTHLSTGLLFSAIVFLVYLKIDLSPIVVIGIIFSTVLGSSAPDLDTPTGGLWNKIPGGKIAGHIVHPVFLGGHRHLSHSFIGLGLFILLFNWLLHLLFPGLHTIDLYLLAFIAGLLSHLIADMFTEEGVPIFFPLDYHFGIPPDPFQKVRIKTGRWFENLVIYPVVNVALFFVIWHYFNS